jgi:hypothetical protein
VWQETSIQVVSVALADVVPDIKIVRQTQTAIVTVTPHEISSGNVSFSVLSDTTAVTVSNFQFFQDGECPRHIPAADCLKRNSQTFTVTYSGFGSSEAEITLIGRGVGNYDGFRSQLKMRLLPGLDVSPDRLVLQQYPGVAVIEFGPDTRPNRETFVRVHVITEYGTDAALDSYQQQIVLVPDVLVMPQGLLTKQTFRITHGGVEGNRMRNRVSGKAVVTFSVSDPGNIYHGTGIIGSGKSIEIDVLPGFESNVQDTYRREVQRDTKFVLVLTLDEATQQDINVTATSSNPLAAAVAIVSSANEVHNASSKFTVLSAGSRGPLHVVITHISQGSSQVSIRVLTSGGNYGGVESLNYLQVSLMPGFVTSVKEIELQSSTRTATFSIGFDTRPSADVELTITSSDTSIITATSSLYFDAAKWYEGFVQNIEVVWKSPGIAHISFTASSPGGNFNRASCCAVKVNAFRPLTVSETHLLVQRGGQTFFAVSTPNKPAALTTMTISSFPPGVVSVSEPYTILPGNNDTTIITISHISRGSATVRISASAPGDAYDGVYSDIHVTAMAGFIFSHSLIQLYSCPRSTRCVAIIEFGPEIAPTADVQVTLTASDPRSATIHPTSFTFLAAHGRVNKSITVTMKAPGTSCLSFAATSRGNYDMVSSGGVTVVSYPDFLVGEHIIHPLNAAASWGPHGLAEFEADHPVVYVQNNSYSTFTIAPKVEPNADTVVRIENPRPDLINVTSHVTFQQVSS